MFQAILEEAELLFNNENIICSSPKHSQSLDNSLNTHTSASLSWMNSEIPEFVETPVEISLNDDKIKKSKNIELTESIKTIEQQSDDTSIKQNETCKR